MTVTKKIIKFQFRDVFRSRWVLLYGAFLLLLTGGLLEFSGDSTRAMLSLINVVLLLIPLTSIVFGSIYLYNEREFTELLLSQPINRRTLFTGLYSGLAIPLALAFLLGIGLPFAIYGIGTASELAALGTLMGSGVLLTLVFTALAFAIAIHFEDKVKGLGMAVLTWLVFTVLYDAGVLLFVQAFSEYPLERSVIGLMLLNPVDLGRVILLLNFDVSALMGYTGAAFEAFFGTAWGLVVASTVLLIWVLTPLLLALRWFSQKDF